MNSELWGYSEREKTNRRPARCKRNAEPATALTPRPWVTDLRSGRGVSLVT
jgi:hypothetical protein